MAFSSAPVTDTYSTQRIPLVHDLDANPGVFTLSSANSGMLNVLAYKATTPKTGLDDGVSVYGQARECITAQPAVTYSASTGVVRGFYVWEKTPGTLYFFLVSTDGTTSNVYTSTTGLVGSWTSVNTITNADTQVRFTEFINDTNTKSLIMVTGTEGYVFVDNSAGTEITDVNFPNPHIPFPVFLDGYLFLAKANTGDIYNSNLNDPTTWTAGDFISSEVFPDDIQALVKMNNYLLAIGKTGSEFFYDAATTIGSPLARYEGGILPFGTNFPNSIAASINTVVLLTNSNDGESGFKIIDGMQARDLESQAVHAALSGNISLGTSTAESLRAGLFRQNGELFYALNFNGLSASVVETVVCSLATGYWSRLQLGVTAFPVGFTTSATTTNLKAYVAGVYNRVVFVGYFDSSAYMDYIGDGVTFPTLNNYTIQTLIVPPQTFGTLNRKFLYRLGVYYLGDEATLSGQPPTIQYSDDGGYNWSSSYTLSGRMNSPDEAFPFITQLGSFRSRMFKITYTNKRFRWLYLELDINKGQQ
jgi:hypothetical protein